MSDKTKTQEKQSNNMAKSFADDPRFAAIMDKYLVEMTHTCTQLQEAMDQQAIAEVRAISHRVRGTAASFGFPDIGELAGLCEDHIFDHQELDGIGNKIQELIALLRATGK